MSGTIFIGIDPGSSSGAIAVIQEGTLECVELKILTERDTMDFIKKRSKRAVACLELVHSMPGNGSVSMFKFGMSYGGLRMALIAAGIRFETVAPQHWMESLGIPPKKKGMKKSAWKNLLFETAKKMLPKSAGEITRSTADASLIAEYCRRRFR